MRILGIDITRANREALPAVQKATLSPVAENRGGWFPIVRESFSGAWQQNVEVDANLVLSYNAVFACITLISGDIAKLRVKLVEQGADGIWSETTNPAYSPVLRQPNPYQNRIQFWENWILSKLMRGNTYALKFRDQRGVVSRLYILDPSRVQPMVAEDGSIFYQLHADNISGLTGPLLVPAREIIHDRFNCLFHPLVGVSPIFACGVPATQGLNIQSNSTWLFGNRSMPGGVLTAPGAIGDDTAARLKSYWDANYTGENAGKVAVLGDGLKFESLTMSAVDSELIEQLKWTAEAVCSCFHVPGFMVGVGQMPTHNNVEALIAQYYSQCLQSLIEAAELCLDEGLGIGAEFKIGTEFDLDGLLRMDTATQYKTLAEGIKGGFLTPNAARRKIDEKPLTGGDTVYLQEQNYSLEALAKRDAKADPFAKEASGTAPSAQRISGNDGDPQRSLAARAARIRSIGKRYERTSAA